MGFLEDELWKRNRRTLIGEQNRTVFGAAPTATTRDLEEQAIKITYFVRQCHDNGFDLYNMIQFLIVGACWLGDQGGVDRGQLAKMIALVKLPDGASLTQIVKP